MSDESMPDFMDDFKAYHPPLPRYLSNIGTFIQEQSWTPLEPHCLNLNLELERKNTEITDITLGEAQTKPEFWDFDIQPVRRSRTDCMAFDHSYEVNELEDTFCTPSKAEQKDFDLPDL